MTISPSAKQAAEDIESKVVLNYITRESLEELLQTLLSSELAKTNEELRIALKQVEIWHNHYDARTSELAASKASIKELEDRAEVGQKLDELVWAHSIEGEDAYDAEDVLERHYKERTNLRATIAELREELRSAHAHLWGAGGSISTLRTQLAAAEEGKLALHVKLIDLLHKHGTGETDDCDGEKIVEMVERIVAEKLAAEKEGDEAKSKLSKLGRLIDFAQANNDASTEQEVALSASFNEAMAHENMRIIEAERNAALAALEELKLAAIVPIQSIRAYGTPGRAIGARCLFCREECLPGGEISHPAECPVVALNPKGAE